MNWITIILVLLGLAVLFRLGLLAYAVYTVGGIVLVGRWLARHGAHAITADRHCGRLNAEVGDLIPVEIALRNTTGLPVPWALVEDLLPHEALIHRPPRLEIEGRRTALMTLPGHAVRYVRYRIRPHRRGYYQIGPLVLETGDVFGLHRRYRLLTKPHFLLVYPKVIPIEGYDITSRRPVGEVRLAHRLFEDVTRMCGIRAYQPGDRLNRVHWPATARTGSLQTKVYEPSCVAGATLLLDFHQTSYDQRYEPYRSELAITAAASLAQALYEWGQQVGLITNGRDAADRIRLQGWTYDLRSRNAAVQSGSMLPRSERLRPVIIPTRKGADALREIRETLARLELTDGLKLHELVSETRCRLPRDASVITIVSQLDEAGMIALGNLVDQGYAVTALISIHDEADYAALAGRLIGQGIHVRQLKNEQSLGALCRETVMPQIT